MKYPCNLIKDMLPLYLDDVCSTESREMIENHLKDCADCRTCFDDMKKTEHIVDSSLKNDDVQESRRVSSFRSIKKKLRGKQIFAGMAAIVILACAAALVIEILKNTVRVVPYEDNLSVSMVDGSLIGRLYGSEYSNVKIKNVPINDNGTSKNYIFYQVSDTVWSDISTSENVMSEYVICPKEKNAAVIDKVYYYTGDYTNLESMKEDELKEVIQKSKLLWKKAK